MDNLRNDSCNWSISARRQIEEEKPTSWDNKLPINDTWLTRITWTRRALCSMLLHHLFFYVTSIYEDLFFLFPQKKRGRVHWNCHQLFYFGVFFCNRHKYRCAYRERERQKKHDLKHRKYINICVYTLCDVYFN